MTAISDFMLPPAKLAIGYAEKLLAGITPEMFARQPSPGGALVTTNHPAFVYGHLSLYPARLMTMIGRDADRVPHPARFEELFKAGAECRDDPEGKIYPDMESITSHFMRGTRKAIEAIPSVDPALFAQPNPAEGRARELFPTIGAAANFVLGAHVMMHLGQVSAWRRCMGLAGVL
ncbi:MAG: DinB family protein [Phycisphaeraceae bacterium]|nr:DinB family protein [Phycisphaeraceae bacterium]